MTQTFKFDIVKIKNGWKSMHYKIGEIAKMLGISTATIRYYEQEGLLPHIPKAANGIRLFDESSIEFLKIILCLKRSGMSIESIKEFVDYVAQGDDTIAKRLELFERQRQLLLEEIETLQRTLKYVDYKCAFYSEAKKLGSTKLVKIIPIDEVLNR